MSEVTRGQPSTAYRSDFLSVPMAACSLLTTFSMWLVEVITTLCRYFTTICCADLLINPTPKYLRNDQDGVEVPKRTRSARLP